MRRALLNQLPALTRFYHGAVHYLNVDEFTYAELERLAEYKREYELAVKHANNKRR